MNLAIITTLGANAGDNFVYEGFKNLFPSKHYGSTFLIDKTIVHKDDRYKDLIDKSDLIVICGTPIFYKECYKMRWQKLILEYSKKSKKKILLFAVGSNFKYCSDGTIEIPDIKKDKNYKKFASRYRKLALDGFIVREKYCLQFLNDMGFTDTHQIVCPSLYACDNVIGSDDRDLIFIIWGGTYWNCDFSSDEIFLKCQKVYEILQSRFTDKRVIWVCHDFVTYSGLLKNVARQDILYSNNYIDFLKYYRRCYFAFSVKLHGSMLLASMGISSLLMQLDSRAAVMEAINEECAPPSSSVDNLIYMCDKKLENVRDFRDRASFLKERYREEYEKLFVRLGFM